MSALHPTPLAGDQRHEHVFLGEGHDKNGRKTWAVIVLCGVMMIAEIVGGSLFGSLALVADGLHMSTHAGAMLIATLAYTYARKHARDPRFVFGTGKLGDLAGFTSAIVLAMIALLIGYEAITRLLAPVPIRFAEAIPIAVVGLIVNIASAWLLSGDDHHGHGHGHGHGGHDEEVQRIQTSGGTLALSIFEDGVAPVFRIHAGRNTAMPAAQDVTVTTIRADETREVFSFLRSGDFLESTTDIPEPHRFQILFMLPDGDHVARFEEHAHGDDEHGVNARDHNMRAAYLHVIADAFVSVLAIIGLLLAQSFAWLWMDPLAGIAGALVIANWSYGLARDTGAILMDVSGDERLLQRVRNAIETIGDRLLDLHVWRLGPGHLGAVVSVATSEDGHDPAFYHAALGRFKGLSHITVEVHSTRRTG